MNPDLDRKKSTPNKVALRSVDHQWSYGPFRITVSEFQIEKYDGSFSRPIRRVCFERGDSAGILLYNKTEDCVFLVQQFRFPAYSNLSREEGFRPADAWLYEIVAGIVDSKDSDVRGTVRSELLEEAGVSLANTPELIYSIFPSPGGSSEKIHIFLGYIADEHMVGEGGGLDEEDEDIRFTKMPLPIALQMLDEGRIVDAKTIIALQFLAIKHK